MGLGDDIATWWAEVTAPQATLLAAAGFALIGSITIWQKLRTDRRDQWWKRAQWALDLTLSDDEWSQILGWAAIEHLADGGDAAKKDHRMFLRVVDAALGLEARSDDRSPVLAPGDDKEPTEAQDEPSDREGG